LFPFRIFPILCNYHITTRCNARCTFCHIYKEKNRSVRKDDVIKNLLDLKKLGIRFIDFTGGEPLLHPDIPEMLQTAKQLGFITTVTTNCILYPRRAHELRGLIDLLHFSLDGPSPKVHDRIRGASCFHLVMESFAMARDLGERPDILYTVDDTNLSALNDMIQIAIKLGLILLVNPVFSYFGNPGVDRDTIQTILSAGSQPNVYINRGILRLMNLGGNRPEQPRCRAVSTTVVISPENRLLLPCYHKAVQGIPIQGNLRNLVHHPKVQNYKKREGRFSFCEGCAISCYFDPSFTHGVDDYFLLSQMSKMKYVWNKYIRLKSSTTK
jgi:MoaA/NifB/PqqE/SkfB family radical SAM enzyme